MNDKQADRDAVITRAEQLEARTGVETYLKVIVRDLLSLVRSLEAERDTLKAALESLRWTITICGACGHRYRRCVLCGQGVRNRHGADCAKHPDSPCAADCKSAIGCHSSLDLTSLRGLSVGWQLEWQRHEHDACDSDACYNKGLKDCARELDALLDTGKPKRG